MAENKRIDLVTLQRRIDSRKDYLQNVVRLEIEHAEERAVATRKAVQEHNASRHSSKQYAEETKRMMLALGDDEAKRREAYRLLQKVQKEIRDIEFQMMTMQNDESNW